MSEASRPEPPDPAGDLDGRTLSAQFYRMAARLEATAGALAGSVEALREDIAQLRAQHDRLATDSQKMLCLAADAATRVVSLEAVVGVLNRIVRDGNGVPSHSHRIATLEERLSGLQSGLESAVDDLERHEAALRDERLDRDRQRSAFRRDALLSLGGMLAGLVLTGLGQVLAYAFHAYTRG